MEYILFNIDFIHTTPLITLFLYYNISPHLRLCEISIILIFHKLDLLTKGLRAMKAALFRHVGCDNCRDPGPLHDCRRVPFSVTILCWLLRHR